MKTKSEKNEKNFKQKYGGFFFPKDCIPKLNIDKMCLYRNFQVCSKCVPVSVQI